MTATYYIAIYDVLLIPGINMYSCRYCGRSSARVKRLPNKECLFTTSIWYSMQYEYMIKE